MILYHGTNYQSLVQIQKKGLLSKVHHGKSNWNHTVPSNPKFIYLTTAYGLFYAAEAAKESKDYPVIIKVDTGTTTLYPDDDFIGQALWKLLPPEGRELFGNLVDFTKTIDIELYQKFAQDSIKKMGNCAVKRLKGKGSLVQAAIIRNRKLILGRGGDPIICPMNYELLSHFYCPLMQFFFGECEYPLMFPEIDSPVTLPPLTLDDWKVELVDLR